jgi:hypothetical protein
MTQPTVKIHPAGALPDTVDFRDLFYQPSLINLPVKIDKENFKKEGIPVLNQKNTPACTGFALATKIHYLLKKRHPLDFVEVSPKMLYEMAKRYDEWPGEDYEGSSLRGVMKGFH